MYSPFLYPYIHSNRLGQSFLTIFSRPIFSRDYDLALADRRNSYSDAQGPPARLWHFDEVLGHSKLFEAEARTTVKQT